MKNLLVVFALVLSLSTIAEAANGSGNAVIQEQATAQTRLMSNFIHFNEYEYIRIKKMNTVRLLEISEAQADFIADKAGLQTRLNKIEQDYENALQQVFTPQQYQAYNRYKQEQRPVLLSVKSE